MYEDIDIDSFTISYDILLQKGNKITFMCSVVTLKNVYETEWAQIPTEKARSNTQSDHVDRIGLANSCCG